MSSLELMKRPRRGSALAVVALAVACTSPDGDPASRGRTDAGTNADAQTDGGGNADAPVTDGGTDADAPAADANPDSQPPDDACASPGDEALFAAAALEGAKASEGLERAHRFVRGWSVLRDTKTGLYPQNFTSTGVWTIKNAASDLWPFMVLSTYFTDRAAFDGDMHATLASEIALASRVGVLPDDYDFAAGKFVSATPVMSAVVFGSAEYIKDGLTPIFELLREPAYFDRMTAIATALCDGADVPTATGPIPSTSMEVNGDVMLTLTRLYTATGDARYLACSRRIAEYYLFENPAVNSASFVIKDHGGEITAGLVEAYLGLKLAGVPVEAHRVALKKLLDRILEVGRNPDGFFYSSVDLVTGQVLDDHLADTWGYVYAGYYTYHLAEGEPYYRDEVVRTLENLALPEYANYAWEGGSADGDADSIESAIYLLNWEPVPAGFSWVESQARIMFEKQHANGLIESWYGDGNFARTALLYALMHSKGVHAQPWRADLRLGAVRSGGGLYVHASAAAAWTGQLCFDTPRHATHLGLPFDYPRLNAYPEWYTVEPGRPYDVSSGCGPDEVVDGEALVQCFPVTLPAGTPVRLTITEVRSEP